MAVVTPAGAVRAARTNGGWLLGGLTVLVVGAGLPVLLAAPGRGSQALGVLIFLLGACLWLGALALWGARRGALTAAAAVAVLNLARVPAPHAVEYGWREPLFRTDQSVQASVSGDALRAAKDPALYVLAEAVLDRTPPPYAVAATLGQQAQQWDCAFVPGRQWLRLPLAAAPSSGGPLPVTLHLVGEPDRAGNFLYVYARAEARDFFILAEPSAGTPAPMTTCQPRAGG